jgi:acetate kinase
MSDIVFVLNSGSSSIKFQLFALEGGKEPSRLIAGRLEGIGSRPRLIAQDGKGDVLVEQNFAPAEIASAEAAYVQVSAFLAGRIEGRPVAIGHRIVHGGPDFAQPVRIDAQILRRLEALIPLAPLHQPGNLAPMRAILAASPDLPQIACFDTAFHRGHGELADRYPLPDYLYAEGVRRYGFHGLSYEFIARHLSETRPDLARGRVIVAHLGNGCSMCAMQGGRSIDSTMGFTTLDGIPMGTRPGALDPGILLYLMEAKNMSAESIRRLLYHESGLMGLSGIGNDVRELEASEAPQARFALEYFAHRVAKELGALMAVLGGLNALIFTAGIGENSAFIRKRIVEKSAWAGLVLDEKANAIHAQEISARDSRLPILVLPTDEERMIALHCVDVLSGG